MTKKDYELIASAFAIERRHYDGKDENIPLYKLADLLAQKLKAENPRFNRPRFMEAAGCPDLTMTGF